MGRFLVVDRLKGKELKMGRNQQIRFRKSETDGRGGGVTSRDKNETADISFQFIRNKSILRHMTSCAHYIS